MEQDLTVSERARTTIHVNAGILFLRFLAAHSLSLLVGVALSLLTLPLWTRILYRITDKDPAAQVSWAWYLLTLAPFYLAISTLTLLVVYVMWTGASAKMKSWRRVLRVTVWIHLFLLLFVNMILGGRAMP
jgi:hypothetical protein